MADDVTDRLARIETKLAQIEASGAVEHGAGMQRGLDQSRIGERVAALEATMRHLEMSIQAINTRATAAASGSIGSMAGIIYLIVQLTGTTP